MAHTAPVPASGSARLQLFAPDTTPYSPAKYLSGDGVSWHHSKSVDGSGLFLTANRLEAELAADETILDDGFAVVEVDETPTGTPFLLAPGSGTVIGAAEASAREQTPVGVGALQGLAGECVVLPRDLDPSSVAFRYAGGIEQNRYIGWMTADYDDTVTGWHDADVYDPTGHPKENKPPNWGAAGGEWVFRSASEGGLTLFRFGYFTLASDARVHISSSSDENHKVYLDGPNQGGCVIDFTGDEDGYNDEPGYWSRRLEAGSYFVAGEMRTVNSAGGDGNDSMRLAVWTFDGSFDRSTPTELLVSDGTARVHRQSATAERPGLTVGHAVRVLLTENYQQSVDAAVVLINNATFTDTLDSAGGAWSAGKEWVWPLGTFLSSVLVDMAEEADFDMGTAFSFDAYDDRGDDLSSSVGLIPGASPATAVMNIQGETYTSDPGGPSSLLTLSQDGFDVRDGTPVARKRIGFAEFGAAPSIGRARHLADVQIRQAKYPRRFYSTVIVAVSGAVPYDDFGLCDRVSGRDFTNTAAVQEVTGIGGSQDEGSVDWTIETGEV